MGNNDNMLDMYLYETNTLLEQLDSIVLAAEQVGTLTQDEVNEIFRIMHTLKGSASMMEYTSLATIAHRIEDLFFIIRDKGMDTVPPDNRPALFDLMFQSIDYIRSEVEKIESNAPLSQDIGSFVDTINSFVAKISGEAPAEPVANIPVATPAADAATAAPAADAAHSHQLRVFFDEDCGMENLRAFMLLTSVQEICPEACSEPADVDSHPESASIIAEHGFLITFPDETMRTRAVPVVTSVGYVRSYEMLDMAPPAPQPEPVAPPEPTSTDSPAPAPVAEAVAAPVASAPAPAAQAVAQQNHAKQSLISVNLSKLDELMAVVGEIVITESMVTASPDLKDLNLDNFTKSARQLRKLTDSLQDISMSLRMVPVSGTFQKMNRIVRDMGQKLGKPTNLTIIGEETEVDKTIVDGIADPIMHIVRNSMDHGIEERPADRVAAGKDPTGEIILSAEHTGSEVIITIADDGTGVDCDKVLAKAKRQGLLANPDAEYTQKEILNLLMLPGFSTNAEVTEYSGRGVGMDVVKRNVEEVGGSVTISSEKGKGTRTTLKIPLTMAIMDGMEVLVGDSIFTIPIHNIRQSFKISPDAVIRDAARGEMVKRMDHFYPVVRIHEMFQLDTPVTNIEDGILVWVETSESSYCLFVDELIGQQQVVVKPLPNYVNSFNIKNYGIVGCTILGDGNISIILDVANLYASTL